MVERKQQRIYNVELQPNDIIHFSNGEKALVVEFDEKMYFSHVYNNGGYDELGDYEDNLGVLVNWTDRDQMLEGFDIIKIERPTHVYQLACPAYCDSNPRILWEALRKVQVTITFDDYKKTYIKEVPYTTDDVGVSYLITEDINTSLKRKWEDLNE